MQIPPPPPEHRCPMCGHAGKPDRHTFKMKRGPLRVRSRCHECGHIDREHAFSAPRVPDLGNRDWRPAKLAEEE